MKHKAGYVNILGEPNAGKSTLMNALVGERLSIISPKAQTTRHRILGIVNDDDHQIVFSDTPGILDPVYKLHEAMMKAVKEALSDGDVYVLVTDASQPVFSNEVVLKHLQESKEPVLIALNKIDVAGQDTTVQRISEWQAKIPRAIIIPVSALHGAGLPYLLSQIKEHLPENPPYYPKDQLTDRSERFFVSEIIREKIMDNYGQEIPYSCEVVIDTFKEKPEITAIRALILVMRESQKGILIGKGGSMLKKVGIEARQEIERFLGVKVFLELQVKVAKNWREDPTSLKRFGYGD